MHRINTFLILFFAFFFLLVFGSWNFLQSKTFGNFLSKTITKIASEQLDAEVSFSQVAIKFFPPALGLENVKIAYDRLGTKINAEAGEIGVEFDVDLFKGDKIHLQQVYLNQGHVDLEISETGQSTVHPWDMITGEIKKLPIDIEEIEIKKSKISIFKQDINVNNLVLTLQDDSINFDGSIKHLLYQDMPDSIDLLNIKGSIQKEMIRAEEMSVIQKRSQIMANLTVTNWHKISDMNVSGGFDTDVFIPDLAEWISVPEINFQNGSLRTKGRFSWSNKDGMSIENKFEIKDLVSNFLLAKFVKGELSSNGINVYLEHMVVENDTEKASINERVLLWDNSRSITLPDGVSANLESFKLSNALRIVGEPLKPLKGELNGRIRFNLKKKDLYFYPLDGFFVKDLMLVVGDSKPIINAPKITLSQSEFFVLDNVLVMKSRLSSIKTQLEVQGHVGKGQVDFTIPKGVINLEDLGNIASLELKGIGENSLRVKGPIRDVVLSFGGNLKGFEILGYKLGDVNQEINLSLKNGIVDIPVFKAKKSRYEFQGTGSVNYKNFDMDLNIDIPQISFSEFKDAIKPLANGLSFLPKDFDAVLQGNVSLTAKNEISNLKVEADIYAQKIVAYEELFQTSKFSFLSENRTIQLKNFSIEKETGRLAGEIKYLLDDSKLLYNLSLRSLSSSELNIYKLTPLKFEFVTLGEFSGSYSESEQKHKGFLGLINTRIEEEKLPDSKIEWNFDKQDVLLNLNLFDGWVTLNSNTIEEGRSQKILSSVELDIKDFPLFLRGLFGENSQLTSATGELKASSTISFIRNEDFKPTGSFWLKELSLITPQIALQQKFNEAQVEFDAGLISKWKINIDNQLLKFKSRGVGDFRTRYRLENYLEMDAIFFELLSKNIQRAQGKTVTQVGIKYDGDYELSADIRGNGIVVSTDLLPFAISDLNYQMTLINKELDINYFKFKPASGLVSLNGGVLFDKRQPDVNLSYNLDRANIPIKNRSDITLTGNGLIFGGRPPYLINGNILINKGIIANEINDFTSQSSVLTDIKYLPKEQDSNIAGIFNLDVGVRTENALQVNNSLMDLFLQADLQLLGDPLRPVAEGRVTSSGIQSKVFFKNSEYIISKSEFLFNSKKDITKPDFDIVANSNIANYKVYAKIFGTPDNFTFDLSSEPALSKQNILSLVAFGYTEDISNAITPEERQQLTNVGVGSFIFDQFKVTDIVKKQFGLQVNLGTMFVQAEESMLAGRGQEQSGSGTLARTRTATNIEVKKRLSEAMTLSVSSTVGGQIGQRQRMNLNYGISKGVQLEGVYELRTNAEGQEDIIDNSIGGDIKFRMSFK